MDEMEHRERTEGKMIGLRITALILLVLFALLSFFPAAKWAEAPETHRETIQSIDDKIDTVLKLAATSTVASAGISAIPGDTATPIAEKLADFSEYFLLILSVLYAEKYLQTVIGAGAFKILIPAACLVAAIGLFWNQKGLRQLAMKLAVAGLALFFVIPLSIRVSEMIYDAYQVSIDETISTAETFSSDTSALAEGEEEKQGLIGSITSAFGSLTDGAENLTERAADILNRFIETLAVMIVTSCVIPILVLLFCLWIIKLLTGAEISPPPIPRTRRHL